MCILQCLETHEAIETLGVLITAAGNKAPQNKKLQKMQSNLEIKFIEIK